MKDQMVRVAKEFAADESGVGVVEMILILVVLIGLVIIFKKQLTNLVNSIFETINSSNFELLTHQSVLARRFLHF